MKRKLNSLIMALFFLQVVITTSCRENLLETVPTDRISTDVFWKTEQDATSTANAIYNYLESGELFLWDGFSDIAHINTTGATEAVIDMGSYDAQNARIAQQWSNAYAGIRAANYFLENVDKVPTSNTTLINSLKGQVKTLRAYFYLRLVSWFGDVPLITKTITIEEAQQVKRDNVSDIYNFIHAELTEAASLLPAAQTDKGRITKGAALALDARAMLYAGRYREAADAAKSVMDLKQYSLYTKYQDLFSYAAENNSEVIIDKEFIMDIYSNAVFHNFAPSSQATSLPNAVPTKQGADMYEMKSTGKIISDPNSGFDPYNPYNDRDPRMRYSMYVPGDVLPDGTVFRSIPGSGTADAVGGGNLNATRTGYNFKKYINKEDLAHPSNCGINIILLRYAEVLLTYAESKIELNEIDQSVFDAINAVRQRSDVNMPPINSPKTQTEMRDIVRRERTVELAFEGLHVFDIRRWKTAASVMPGAVQGITYVKDGKLVTVTDNSFVRSFDPNRDYLWPIPQQELILDKNLVQNPGW